MFFLRFWSYVSFLAKSHENDLKVYFLTVQRAAGENFLCLFFVIRISLIESSCFLCIFPRKYGFFDFHMYVFWIFEIPYVRKDTYVYTKKNTVRYKPACCLHLSLEVFQGR